VIPSVQPPQNESKVYIEIVKQLRFLISEEKLKAGDKLPSERELSERLTVGRSSVREALRSLELLGLIETRRGEGTFIRDFRGNQLVQLLGTFVLQDEKAIKDILETKHCIELDCLKLIIKRGDFSSLQLKGISEMNSFSDEKFFLAIAQASDNHLMLRIWQLLNDYFHALEYRTESPDSSMYDELISALEDKNEPRVVECYLKLRKLS
jgi:GntR family transcriptional regulator, transcriptional repressor for pyruvate dehydrogenase complex